ncbi:hypothetical protein H5410_030062 [Solanum commersonii]|uniref:Uncharacterized protein n=1 Tax=Solanum commersonii TaxID=4109 RepID=A0A9J5YHI7_SOLCO|nr:hypothetical protein H5410_030062 [Solanum commersonii]
MKSFTMLFLFSMTIFFTLFDNSLGDDTKFCPGTFTTNDQEAIKVFVLVKFVVKQNYAIKLVIIDVN